MLVVKLVISIVVIKIVLKFHKDRHTETKVIDRTKIAIKFSRSRSLKQQGQTMLAVGKNCIVAINIVFENEKD